MHIRLQTPHSQEWLCYTMRYASADEDVTP